MCKLVEIIEKDYFVFKKLAYDIFLKEGLTDEDIRRLYNALKACKLLLIVLEEGSPNLYREQKKDFDAFIVEIKSRFKPEEYVFSGSLKSILDEDNIKE